METDSVEAYDFGIGTLSLASFVPLIRVQLLVVQRRFREALLVLDSLLDSGRQDMLPRRDAQFWAERGWCHANLGNAANALGDVERTKELLAAAGDADDLAATCSRVAATIALVGGTSVQEWHERALDALARHKGGQDMLLRLLEAQCGSVTTRR